MAACSGSVDVVAAGHVCLDLIPAFGEAATAPRDFFQPGKLSVVGPPAVSTGGAVSNTGLALHRLGIPVRLAGKIGDDDLGRIIHRIFSRHSPALAEGLIVSRSDPTSYTIVLNPPGVDRMFLHCPGANDTFCSKDVTPAQWSGARLFHFGYPPLMRRMYQHQGRELSQLLGRVKKAGLTTSLDMAQPDPASEAGRVDWPAILARTLPHVDVFLPSIDEILYMLDPAQSARLAACKPPRRRSETLSRLSGIASQLLDWGAAVVVLKLGEDGLYVRTTPDRRRLKRAGACLMEAEHWAGRELLAPCFEVDVAGTTGSGDTTIAGFLAGMLQGQPLPEALTLAVAVGACSVEVPDATSGVPALSKVLRRMRRGWARKSTSMPVAGWTWDEHLTLWRGPAERSAAEWIRTTTE